MKWRTLFNAGLILAGLFFTVLMFRITYPYFSFRYDVDFLLTKQTVLHISLWRLAFYTHISSSIFVLFFGILQFVPGLLQRYRSFHRSLGKGYVLLVIFIAAPSGLIMGYYANGGIWAQTSFMIIALLWWYFTYRAYMEARRKNYKIHLAFMYRSFALTLSAITLRSYVYLLPAIIHLKGKDMYVLVAWASWIPNLIVAEFLIARISDEKLKLPAGLR